MVALITPSSSPVSAGSTDGAVSSPPTLRLIRGGLGAPRRDHSLLVGLVAVSAVLAAVIGLRLVQGQPPSNAAVANNAWASAPVAMADRGEAQRVVAEGDTLWAIAEDLAPGRDPRPIVDALADRNGGSALRAGDVLVIPAEVLASVAPAAVPTVAMAAEALD